MKLKYVIILLLLLCSGKGFSQTKIEQTPDYSAIDNYAKTVKYKGDLKLLVSDLTKNCTTELEKTRAIFIWVTHNV